MTLTLHCLSPKLVSFALLKRLMLSLACLSLFGCAAQMAYRDGNKLIEQGQHEQGLKKLKEAADAAPMDPVYRSSYLRNRENVINDYLANADRLIRVSKNEEARKQYLAITTIEPNNVRAFDGLAALDREANYQKIITDAKQAVAQNNRQSAINQLRGILAEQPTHAAATALMNEITHAVSPTNPDTSLAAVYKKPITIEFRDASLKQVFEVIARTSGLNFLFDKDVRTDQRTSIFLKNSTVQSAVHFTLLTNQLEQQVLDANTILIFPNTATKLKEYQEMVVKTFFLTNAEAKNVALTLKTIIKSKDIVVDEKLNLLIIRDSPDAIKIAEKLIALQDVPEPEVMLEVEVLEIKRTQLLELGVKWPENISLTPLTSGANAALTLFDLKSNLNSRTIGAAISPVTVNAKAQDSDVRILANPRIRTRNHEKAKIQIGERVPNVTTTSTAQGFVSESITYTDVGLKLEVEPTVFLDNDVGIRVNLEVSNVVSQSQTKAGSTAYQLGTRNASTVLRLKDGETQILAGLINNEDRNTGNKVPGLGEFPIIGRLFGSTLDNNQKTEIVLSITPRLIRNIKRPDAALSEFLSGTESNFRVRPDNTPEPTPGALPGTQSSSAIEQKINPVAPTLHIVSPVAASGAVSVAAPATAAGSGTSPLQIQAPSVLSVGDTFILQIAVQPTQAISSLPFTMSYDPNVLEVLDVKEGNFMNQSGAQSSFSTVIDQPGKIAINITRKDETAVSQIGTVASVTMRAKAIGNATQIIIASASAKTNDKQFIAVALPAPHLIQIK